MQKGPHRVAMRSYGGATRNRTGDEGFADLCLTAWLWRHPSKAECTILPVPGQGFFQNPREKFRSASQVVISKRSRGSSHCSLPSK